MAVRWKKRDGAFKCRNNTRHDRPSEGRTWAPDAGRIEGIYWESRSASWPFRRRSILPRLQGLSCIFTSSFHFHSAFLFPPFLPEVSYFILLYSYCVCLSWKLFIPPFYASYTLNCAPAFSDSFLDFYHRSFDSLRAGLFSSLFLPSILLHSQ